MSDPVIPVPSPPVENVPRGTLVSLLVLPIGVAAWLLIWNLGFIASIVAFGVAIAAVWLYRLGSGGRVGRTGAVRVTIVTIITLVVALVAGFAVDLLGIYTTQRGLSFVDALLDPAFWSIVFGAMFSGSNLLSVLLALGFGVLGCFSVLRSAFRSAEPESPGPAQAA